MNPEVLQKVLECRNLPSLPAVAARVLELTQNSEVSLKDLTATITNDQALAAKVLKTVNSSFFGLRQRCSTINQAIVLLGLSAVKTLALGFSLVSAIAEVGSDEFDRVAYWRRALYTGVAAKCISKEAGCGFEEEAFLGGLLQDIGMIALDQALGSTYRAILARAGSDHRALSSLELAELEVQHADIGAMLAHRWKLPEELTLPVKYHERPTAAPAGHLQIVRAVGLGNIASDVLTSPEPAGTLSRFYARAEQWFLIKPAAADDILKKVSAAAKELSSLLRIDAGPKAEVDRILHQARERLLALPAPSPEEVQPTDGAAPVGATDELTGVASRLRFDQTMVAAFEQARAGAGTLSVAIFEADDFASINAKFGQDAGDTVLVTMARRLGEVFKVPGTLLCRYSDLSFAVAMPGTERTDAVRLASTALQRIADTPVKLIAGRNAPPTLSITASVGLASATTAIIDRLDGFCALTRICEQALENARAAGPSKMRVYAPAA